MFWEFGRNIVQYKAAQGRMLFGVLRPKLGPAKIPRIRLFLHKKCSGFTG